MRKALLVTLVLCLVASFLGSISLNKGDRSFEFDRHSFPLREISVRYEGPELIQNERNLGDFLRFEAIPLVSILQYVDGMNEADLLKVTASDRYSRSLPYEAVYGQTMLGRAFIGFSGETAYLVFLPTDGEVTNDKMLASLGEEFSTYHRGLPSARGLLIKDVAYLSVTTVTEATVTLPETEDVKNETDVSIIEVNFTGLARVALDLRAIEREFADSFENISLERRGELKSYTAIPFWTLIKIAAQSLTGRRPDLTEDLWEAGIEVTLTAGDGYTVTFDTAELSRQSLYVSISEDGVRTSPSTIGDVSGSLRLKDLVSIEVDAGWSAVEVFEKSAAITLKAGEREIAFTMAELEEKTYYVEEYGQYTTSSGKEYANLYGGVDLVALISELTTLNIDSTLKIRSTDGYEMTYAASELLDRSEGVWILAFKKDGEYLPEEPGYFRTVKVGPDTPNISSHKSAKMVESLEIIQKAYRDFSLSIKGLLDWEIDRTALESGVSCHRKTVVFARKGEENSYTGIPLWRLLAFGDDPEFAPHKQDKSIVSYDAELAISGYAVEIVAEDGFKVTLNSSRLHMNDDVIIAIFKNGSELPDDEWPMVLVWDTSIETPEGMKPVKSIAEIRLLFD